MQKWWVSDQTHNCELSSKKGKLSSCILSSITDFKFVFKLDMSTKFAKSFSLYSSNYALDVKSN